jgi:mRNA interferase MazF
VIKGEIWWANLPDPRGSEPAKRRPVLVVQNDIFNRSAINTVICAVITSNLHLANAPFNILLEKGISKLEKTSVVNISQIITLDKAYLTELVSMLPKYLISQVDNSLKNIFDIGERTSL